MRKLIMSLSILAGLLFAGTISSTANAAAGLTVTKPKVEESQGEVTKARYRRHWGGPNIYFGFGSPYFYGPRYGYYDDYYYGRPYYYRGHRRHWRHGRHHRGWGHHRGHRGWGHHRRHRR